MKKIRTFLDKLGKQLGFNQMNDWYNITGKDIKENGGSGLLSKYGNSPSKLIMSIYSNHEWKQSNFNTKYPSNYWNNQENRIELMKNLTKKLEIKYLSDWYRISLSQIGNVSKHESIIRKYSLEKLLQEAFPNHEWNISTLKYKGNIGSSQRQLRVMIEKLFPQSGSHFNL